MSSGHQYSVVFFCVAVLLTASIFLFLILTVFFLKAKQNKKNKEHLQGLIEEKERTMYMISLEVHDNLCQMLLIARMNMHLIEDASSSAILPAIKEVSSILDLLIVDTQNISHTLNSSYLKKNGLIRSLQKEVDWINASRKIESTLEVEGAIKSFPAEIELMIFRIAQEAINNVIKHAHAQKLEIKLTYKGKNFDIMIIDDGEGFVCNSAGIDEGMGIAGMHQRAKLINGNLTIISNLNAGTTIILKLRLPETI